MSILSIVICLVGLGILAAFHEVGHFIAARALGIKVVELSIFVGPKLIGWNRKGVDYAIRLIPFGAYVRFVGIDEEDGGISNKDSILNQPRWKRLLVSLAGPITNFILGAIIFFFMFQAFGFSSMVLASKEEGTQIYQTEAMPGDEILAIDGQRVLSDLDFWQCLGSLNNTDSATLLMKSKDTGEKYEVVLTPEVTDVYMLGVTRTSELDENGGWVISSVDPEQNDGNPVLEEGDSIISVNGVSVSDPTLSDVINENGHNTLEVTIIRGGKEMNVQLVGMLVHSVNYRGIILLEGSGLWNQAKDSVLYSFSVVKVSVETIADIFQGDIAATDAVSGPVGIASVVSDVVDEPATNNTQKISTLVFLAGLISVGLAFSNLLPIPGLDGNAMVLVLVEMIRGKKLSTKTEMIINAIGFAVLIALVAFAWTSDIMRLAGG